MAQAQATRTWVSGVGDDANPCSRTAPCKTFAGAISKTAAKGVINCLDPGGFGGVTITKSLMIRCQYTEAGVLVSGTNAIIVNTLSTDVVYLEGLDLLGLGTGLNGISFLGGGTLHVKNCVIRLFNGANGNGINFAPSTGLAQLDVSDTYISDNGNGVSTAGILIKPTGGANANVIINNVELENNLNGILANGTAGANIINLNVRDCKVTHNSNSGIVASTTTATINATIDRTTVSYSANTGIASNGGLATVRIGSSTISNNVTGVAALGGSTMQSFKNNQFSANGTDGTPIPAVPGGPLN
ncbi:MAG: right-handed parallel beta-helix repeat-containing protein [Acidobacteriota bacterium]